MQILFVDDESRVLSGIERAIMMHDNDWVCRFATSGQEALSMLEQTAADVVVSDMRMPFMDGAELLTQVRSRWPGTVRFILSGYSEPVSTRRMLEVAHQFLPKPCDSARLLDIIESTLIRRNAVADSAMIEQIGHLSHLPAACGIFTELTQHLKQTDNDISLIANLIASDPALSLKLLQLANSAWFTQHAQVYDSATAITKLGLEQITLLLISSPFLAPTQTDPCVNDLQRSAFIASTLAARICGHPGLASTSALLANIALLVPEIRIVDETITRPTRVPVQAVAAAYLLALWGLPRDIVDIVTHQATPAHFANNAFGAMGTVHVAVALANNASPDHGYLEQTGMLSQLPQWQEMLAQIKETFHV